MFLLLAATASTVIDEHEKYSVFGINDDFEIEWRIEVAEDELATGFHVPSTENVTRILIVCDNILLRSYALAR